MRKFGLNGAMASSLGLHPAARRHRRIVAPQTAGVDVNRPSPIARAGVAIEWSARRFRCVRRRCRDRISLTMPPMSIFGFARTVALISGVLGFAAIVGAQATPSDPARFVASIYANGREPAVWRQWPDGARRGQWFSSALTALWAQCDRRARKERDELGPLDFDVATNSQGAEVKSFTVRILARRLARERRREAYAQQLAAQIGSRERDPLRPPLGARTLDDRRRPFGDRTEHVVAARNPDALPR